MLKSIIFASSFVLLLLIGVLFWWEFDTDETIVAVLDTGVNNNHKTFEGKIIEGYNFLDFNKNTSDEDGHGTGIAGLVLQEGGDVKILPVKMIKNKENNYVIALSILYSVFKGADIINMSFSANTKEKPFIEWAIKYGQSKGVIFVGASGNDGKRQASFPSSVEGVFSIGNVDFYGDFAETSNYGERIDYVTNGENAAMPMHNHNKKYTPGKGTSLASGRFSGYIAYLLNMDPSLSKKEIEVIMTECSRTIIYKNTKFVDIHKRFLESCHKVQRIENKDENKLVFKFLERK
ncbi:S8 family serine peptidase [Cytobacillus sp. FJAT-54145]|uniref:S8 family serine peptidase n=1 Tax=Cytobacillus spartinae TaxID=3299023 RepID=A0ABW6KAH0_9BACI